MTGRALTATVLWLLVAVACGSGPASAAETPQAPSQSPTLDTADLLARVAPAVVTVVGRNAGGDQEALGSGMIVRGDGVVLTAWHVVSQATAIWVKLPSGGSYQADGLLFWDTDWDFAALKIAAEDLPTVPLGDSDKVRQGDRVLVVGSPLGLEQTASEGIVSAVRELPSGDKMLQITAAMSPGSSGGPVLNSKGEVVGIAYFLLAEGQSLNFAIPINQVHRKLTGAEELTPLRERAPADFADYPEALYLRGFLALPQEDTAPDAREKFEAAAALFRSAIEKRKDFRSAYLSLGYCLDRLGRYEEAVEAYKQAIRLDPEDTWGYYNLGVACENLDRHQQAVDAYKQAIRTDPDVAEAHAALGRAYMRQGGQYAFVQRNPDWTKGRPLFEQATECFKEAIRLQPDDVQLHADLGLMYSLLGRPREAVEVLTDAIRLKPDHAYAHFHLGGTYLDLGDRGRALEEYKVLKELDAHLAAELFNRLYP